MRRPYLSACLVIGFSVAAIAADRNPKDSATSREPVATGVLDSAAGDAVQASAPRSCPDDVLEFVLGAGSECVKPGETVSVVLRQRDMQQVVRGFQAFAEFDLASLAHVSNTFVTCAGTCPPDLLEPYGVVILDAVTGGDVDLAAGIDDGEGQLPTDDNADLVILEFIASAVEGPTTVTFRAHNPPTRFTDQTGQNVTPCLLDSPPIVIDGTVPLITCPGDTTVECDASVDPLNTGEATATDNLDPSPVIGYSDSVAAGTCTQEKTITRTWTATDCAGNVATCEQIIEVVDTTVPTATQGTIDDCYPDDASAEAAAIAATTDLADSCSAPGNLTVTAATVGDCSASVTVTVADECGNESDYVYATRIDNTPPVLTCPTASPGLIISEIMDGTWPNGLPKFVELANCSSGPIDLSDYSLGNINNGDALMQFNAVVLSGTLAAGDAHVVSFENGDSPFNASFYDVYGFNADDLTPGAFINGNDVLALFSGAALAGDPVDGSGAPVVDVYGEVGVDGTGQVWEYTDGYSYRRPFVASGNAGTFVPSEWIFGGALSLETGDDQTELALMLALTTPGVHTCGDAAVVVYTDPGECSAEVTLAVGATDNCDGAVPVTYEADFGSGYEPISNPYTFPVGDWPVRATAEDECGNTSSCEFLVSVVDGEAPTGTQGTIDDCYPDDASAEAAAIAAMTDLADNCTAPGDLLVSASTVGDCNATVTVLVADEAGNATYFDYFTTIDSAPPVIECPSFVQGDLIISELMDGTLPNGEPKFIELTNCTDSAIDLSDYRIALYANGSVTESFQSMAYGDMPFVLASGASFVVANSNAGPGDTFLQVYGFEADLYDVVANGNGDDVFRLLKDDGVGGDIVVDAYGEVGVDGTGTTWDYEDSYAYSLPGRSANGGVFNDADWFIAGANALDFATTNGIAAATTAGTHVCDNALHVKADAGGCDAVVNFPAPVATDNCDPAPVVVCTPASGSIFPGGTTPVTCTATDDCGNESSCGFDVVVEPVNELAVTVELEPNIAPTGTLTRCVTFEVWECGGPSSIEVSAEIDFDVTFVGPGNSAIGTAVIDVPCGSYTCITARDKLHTLRRTDETFGISGTQYVADFTGNPAGGGDWLIGGNLNDDTFIDILDFGIFSSQFNTSPGKDTTCADAGPHADISGDGVVNNLDFSFIQLNFLKFHEANCCGQPLRMADGGEAGQADDGPVTSITVRELRQRGLSHLAAGDLNRDGVLDEQDIAAFVEGVVPQPIPPRPTVGSVTAEVDAVERE